MDINCKECEFLKRAEKEIKSAEAKVRTINEDAYGLTWKEHLVIAQKHTKIAMKQMSSQERGWENHVCSGSAEIAAESWSRYCAEVGR